LTLIWPQKGAKKHKNKISVGYNWLSIGNNRQKKSEIRCQKLRAGWNEIEFFIKNLLIFDAAEIAPCLWIARLINIKMICGRARN
jgi:hypothetical protein